jgi:ABC-type glycerol-3-phosphate transport system substrate-binding protein
LKRSQKALSLFLAALMLLAMLAATACGGETGQNETTTGGGPAVNTQEDESAGPSETEHKFSDKKFGGETWTVYMRTQTLANYGSKFVIPKEDASDIISQQAVIRNQQTEDKFDIKIVALENDHPYKTLLTDIKGGGKPYDLILDQRRYIGPLGIDGALVNLNNLDVDFNTHWWDGKAAYRYSAAGKLFVIPNDASISNLGGVRFYYFNKEVLDNFRLTSPYEYADKNEWTLATFFQMVKSVSAPNSDGTLGVYGLVNEVSSVRNAMLIGSGVPWLTKVDENTFECQIATSYAERAQNYFDQLRLMIQDTNSCLDFDTAHSMDSAGAGAYGDKYSHCRGLFAQGHFLFVHSNMNCAEEFVDMVHGFGVIMNPKYDADQEEYYHMMDNNSIIFALPKFAEANAQDTIDIMDYWGYVSSQTSMEAYYELTLKTKRASDPTAAGVLDTVKASIGYSLSEVYSNDKYSFNIGDFVSNSYSSTVTKAWGSYKRNIENATKKILSALAEVE